MKMPRFKHRWRFEPAGVGARGRRMAWVGLCLLLACGKADSDLCQVSGVDDESDYVQQVLADRQQRERSYREDPQSPVPAEGREEWPGLAFYPVDPDLRVEGPLIRKAHGRDFAMATSTGDLRPCREVGYFLLDLGEGPERLPVYLFTSEEDAQADLFVPFTDATTDAGETYPAGRYLELESLDHDRYRLDFNLAYNPYCAYGGAWDCPVAPPENHLQAAVRAGETGWQHADD